MKKEWTPSQGEQVWIKVFSNWSSGTYIGFDVICGSNGKIKRYYVREPESGGGHVLISHDILPYGANPNEQQKTHICKYCNTETTQSDEECYARPETLEEAMEKNGYHNSYTDETWREGVAFGVKWQQERMYSEEEFMKGTRLAFSRTDSAWEECVKFLIQQFKKKK